MITKIFRFLKDNRAERDRRMENFDRNRNRNDAEQSKTCSSDKDPFDRPPKSKKYRKKTFLTDSSSGDTSSDSSEETISREKYYDSSSSEESVRRPKRTPKEKFSPLKTKKKDFPSFTSSDDPDSQDKETIAKVDKIIKSTLAHCKICFEEIEPDDNLLCYKCDEIFHK